MEEMICYANDIKEGMNNTFDLKKVKHRDSENSYIVYCKIEQREKQIASGENSCRNSFIHLHKFAKNYLSRQFSIP